MSTSADRAKALRDLFVKLRPELPGEWSVRGKGMGLRLIQEPIEWTIVWIGYSGSRMGLKGWLYAGVRPLSNPYLGWTLQYGLRMDGRPRKPQRIDLLADDALDVARDFIFTAALEKITKWPAQRLAEVAERDFAYPPDERANHWHHLPGWRAILDTGPVAEPARELIAYHEQQAKDWPKSADQELAAAAFHRDLIEAEQTGGRDAALALLEKGKAELLTAEKLDTVVAP